MANTTTQTPDDVDALKALVIHLREENRGLRHNVEVYRRMAFGSSSEKRSTRDADPDHPKQAHLFAVALLEEAERTSREKQVQGTVETALPTKPKSRGGRRARFPDHLPRVKTRYELPEDARRCNCGGQLHEIGAERTKELERVETAIVHEIERAKYACRNCEAGVTTAPGPDRVIDKGLLGPGFLAQIAVDRFGDHMPYHRLEKKYAREGLKLGRSVLERSMARCSELLEPIWKAMGEQVLSAPAIYTDDTGVTIARGSAGKSRRGYMWIYLDQNDGHFYDFTETRGRAGPAAILTGYEGFIHADAYPVYDTFFFQGGATEVACWTHARRKFIESEGTEPERARGVIGRIRELYEIEQRARDGDMDVDQRLALRQKESVPILAELRAHLGGLEAQVLPKSPLATAVRYAQAQWEALCVYATDGRLAIDNNAAERALRPVVVGRNGWLFVQNLAGGKRTAILLSLVMTAKAIGINPVDYFRDVLLRIARESDVSKLTPHGWKQHFAEGVAADREIAVARLLAN